MTPELQKVYGQSAITFPRKGNSLWPLPADYFDLAHRYQKLARLNAVCNHTSPTNFVAAWNFFRTYYLKQLPPGVFYKRWKPSPPLHFQLVWDLAVYSRNAWAAPRASAKSTVLGTECPLWLAATRPSFDTLMILAKDPFIVKRFGRFMNQFEENPFLLEDFGELRGRGSKSWNHHLLQLMNGSNITGLPVEGKLLSERPDLILPDDPEHDQALVQNPNPSALLEAFSRLLFGTILPMLEEGASIGWIGTLLSNRSFLYYVTQSTDPRFQFWNKRTIAAISRDGELCWKEKWNEETLAKKRLELGEAEFRRQYLNQPGMGNEHLLKIDPQYNTYTVENPDALYFSDPLASMSDMVAYQAVRGGDVTDPTYEPRRIVRPFGKAVGSMYRVITVDYGYTVSRTADFSCICVHGMDNGSEFKDTDFVLDVWLGKLPMAGVLRKIWELAIKWKVHVIAPEAVSIQQALYDQVVGSIDLIEARSGWRPRPFPIKYKERKSKGARISGALEWRFNLFRVKLPVHLRQTNPHMGEMFKQIEDFTEDLSLLPHDDAIDALAMIQEVIRPRSNVELDQPGVKRKTPVEMLAAGYTHDDFGIPYVSSLKPDEIPVQELLRAQREAVQDEIEYAARKGPLIWTPA